MSGHTPGPWRSDYGDARGRYIAADDGYVAIAHYWSRPDEEMQANARLIAAAPEMLAALLAITDSLAAQDDEGLIGHAEPMLAAVAAIAKATTP